MEIIIHRINNIKDLKKINTNYGCEIDIRADKSKLILNHDPYKSGDKLENYLEKLNLIRYSSGKKENKNRKQFNKNTISPHTKL